MGALALNASLVTKGLTAMVTIDDANCVPLGGNETEICEDGTSDSEWPEGPRPAPRGRGGSAKIGADTEADTAIHQTASDYDGYSDANYESDYGHSDDNYGYRNVQGSYSSSASFNSCAWKILLYTLSFT